MKPSSKPETLGPTHHFYPIVGLSFHAPAAEILGVTPTGTPLKLDPEPSNPHDPNAIKVLIDLNDLSASAKRHLVINDILVPQGLEPGSTYFLLGYLPRALAAKLTANGFVSTWGEFSVSASGAVQVKVLKAEPNQEEGI